MSQVELLQLDDAIRFSVPGEPVAFARAGSNGKRRFTPAPQANFMKAVRLYAQQAMRGRVPLDGPVELVICAVFPYPASWPLAKRAATIWKTSKPDATNLGKLPEDALNGLAWRDDAQVVLLIVQKIYGEFPALNVTVKPAQIGTRQGARRAA